MKKTYELTPPFDGAKDLPVHVGWYPSAPKHDVIDPDERRYWNGSHFSILVCVGNSEQEQEQYKKQPSWWANDQLHWCGLTAPYGK